AQIGAALLRGDDAAIENELLLLRLDARLELAQARFDLAVGLAVDVARRLEQRHLAAQLVRGRALRLELAAQRGHLAAVGDDGVDALITAELEREIQGGDRDDRAEHEQRPVDVLKARHPAIDRCSRGPRALSAIVAATSSAAAAGRHPGMRADRARAGRARRRAA